MTDHELKAIAEDVEIFPRPGLFEVALDMLMIVLLAGIVALIVVATSASAADYTVTKGEPAYSVTVGEPCKSPDPFAPPRPPEVIKKPTALTDYDTCKAESLQTGKHLVLWVGYACISSERQMPNVIHCHLPSDMHLPGHPDQIVVVRAPRNGVMVELAAIPPSELCAMTLRQACAGTYQRGSGGNAPARGG